MKLHDDVGVAFVGFLLLNDELPHSSTTSWLLERKSREVWSLEVHKVRIIKFVWLEGFRFSNNICCHLFSAPWRFLINLVELTFKMIGITISKSPPLIFRWQWHIMMACLMQVIWHMQGFWNEFWKTKNKINKGHIGGPWLVFNNLATYHPKKNTNGCTTRKHLCRILGTVKKYLYFTFSLPFLYQCIHVTKDFYYL